MRLEDYHRKRHFARTDAPSAEPRPRRQKAAAPEALPGAKPAALPAAPAPQLATLVKDVPQGEHWLHEIKYDGYRMLCRIDRGRVQLLSRNGRDWSERLSDLATAAAGLPVETAVLDGEVVMVRPDGSTDFQALQNYLGGQDKGVLAFYLFDLVYLDGFDLSRTPLAERKQRLRALLEGAPPQLLYSDHVVGNGATVYREACKLGLEGVISKRADSGYLGKRSSNWTKTKCLKRAEFVIAGYTEPQGTRSGFGALLLGYYDDAGALRYAGKVGAGFDQAALDRLTERLQALEQLKPALAEAPATAELLAAHWVRPELVAEVNFGDWTEDDRLRHAVFIALREDKPAREVTREREADPPRATQAQESASTSAHTPATRAKRRRCAARRAPPKPTW